MLTSIRGIYRKGRIEISKLPPSLPEETPVIVTFLDPGPIDLASRGIDEALAVELRSRLASFAEDWESPEMDDYDHYDAAKGNIHAR
jgi:hypothetical protein